MYPSPRRRTRKALDLIYWCVAKELENGRDLKTAKDTKGCVKHRLSTYLSANGTKRRCPATEQSPQQPHRTLHTCIPRYMAKASIFW